MKRLIYKLSIVMAVLCVSTMSYGQGRTISGKVTTLDGGDPLEGVSVLVTGTEVATVTNAEGSYSISVPDGSTELQFLFIGFKTEKVTLSTGNTVNVQMVEDYFGLGETVVTAIGVKKEVKSLGFAATQVKAKEITQTGERSVLNSLQGRVAGVNISQSSSDPGASTRILIRGVSSMTQNNQPLFVVDGVPMTNVSINSTSTEGSGGDALNFGFDFGNSANAVNPEDIESLNVLKGAAATALYGNRAANGAIIITTKKTGRTGVDGKQRFGVSYSGNVTMSRILRAPTWQNTYGQGWDGNNWLDENGSWGPEFDGRDRVWGRVVDNSQLLKPNVAIPDNFKDFFETGVARTNHVSLSGGDKTSSFYLSYSNFMQDGIMPTDVDEFNRNTVALRGTKKVGWLSLSSSMNYARTNNSFVPTGQEGSSVINNLMQIPRDLAIVDMKDYEAKFYNIEDYFTAYGVTNPYYSIGENSSTSSTGKFFGNVEASAKIRNHWNALYRFGFDINNTNADIARSILLPEGVNSGSVDDPGFVSNYKYGADQINHDVLVSYENKISKDLGFSGFVGLNVNERRTSSLYSSVTGLDIPGFYNLSNSSATPIVNQTNSLRRLIGTFVHGTFDYKGYLFLNLSVRRDQSSTLPSDNNSFTYPAANLSIVFSDLLPKNLQKTLNFGKLRLGYGQSGNDAPPYSVNPVYVSGSIDQPFRPYPFPIPGGVNGFEVGNTLGNLALQPEITNEIEVGTDLRFLKHRLIMDITYYKRNTTNQIFQLPISPSSGFTNQFTNVAEVENQGWEILVTGKIMKSKAKNGFNWDASWNFTKNNNKVVALAEGVEKFSIGGLSTTAYVAVEGEPVGVFEGNVPKTVMVNGEERVVVDGNGVPVAATEKEFYGNSQYDYIMGFANNFSYKGFGLSFNFDIRRGGLMFSRTADISFFTGNNIKTTYNNRQPFIYPNSVVEIDNGDGTFSYVENLTAVDPAHMDDYHRAVAFDRQNVIDKSFIKLRDLVISYNIPSKVADKINAYNMTVSIVGRNLLLFTPTDNQFIDPEVSSFGTGLEAGFGEFSANPTARSLGIALRANF
jgi:TonB-linked SusC/RagA family outer membrane protein